MKKEDIKIAVVGLGYVGLPLACLFARKYEVVGFDINKARVAELKTGHDSTDTFSDDEMKHSLTHGLTCTDDESMLDSRNFFVVSVPTPVTSNHRVDLNPLLGATVVVGRHLKRGDIVVYESTVYPGATEEDCVPVLEQVSGLRYNEDFFIGYSPERINPGDHEHTREKIRKITSGSTPEVADFIDSVYNSVLENGTHRAPTIRVAEAAKIIENCQRDVNIAFMNEINHIFNAMNINTRDVIEAAGTKWNFIHLEPGLVGGHCIGVDPYYLIQKARESGETAALLSTARTLNDTMGTYIADLTIKHMSLAGLTPKNARILVLGFTFKENCNDIRNTKVIDIITELRRYSKNITICDPYAIPEMTKHEYGVDIVSDIKQVESKKYDTILLCVKHAEFADLPIEQMLDTNGILCDIKGFYRNKRDEKYYIEI
ncbi:MAG: nucleotide sugar dehydrogenase [Bacteroidaceae bacterium]|nr:nucleotide sugar dehydrogenase [Bacteroidaceae bacterium]